MRLLNAHTLEIHEFPGDSDKEYAILSHRWREEECTLQHMSMPGVKSRKGYAKIQFCCTQAVKDGLEWAWVDTCCIDKTSTAELSEAINSMFRWYQNAKICYAFLDDINYVEDLAGSLWFTRGWTLQELVAPQNLWFYSLTWDYLGSKIELAAQLHTVTGIEELVLSTGVFSDISVSGRMRWAARRTTTRVEDLAYCLMGIFDVNMPLIYGEGSKAFLRLQQEIMKINSDDQTIFAWGLPDDIPTLKNYPKTPFSEQAKLQGLFAAAPSDFITSHDIYQIGSGKPVPLPVIQHSGLRVQFPILPLNWFSVLVLNCTVRVRDTGIRAYVGIPIHEWTYPYWARYESLILVPIEETENFKKESIIVREPAQFIMDRRPKSFSLARIYHPDNVPQNHFVIDEVYCLPHAKYSQKERRISFPADHNGPQGVIFFMPRFQNIRGLWRFPFAIVLGQHRNAKYAFVPLLTPESPAEDFHRIFSTDKRLVSHCMTKEQLKRGLREKRDWDFPWRTSRPVDGQQLNSLTKRVPTNDDYIKTTREYWDSQLHVALHIGPIDLMENTCYVFLQLRTCKSRGYGYDQTTKRAMARDDALQQFADAVKNRLDNWWKIKEMGWFEEWA